MIRKRGIQYLAEIENGAVTFRVDFRKLDVEKLREITGAATGQFVQLSDAIGITLREVDGSMETFRTCAQGEIDRRFGRGDL